MSSRMTVGDVRRRIENIPDEFEIRVIVPCRYSRMTTVDVEKGLTEGNPAPSRKLMMFETETLEFGPR